MMRSFSTVFFCSLAALVSVASADVPTYGAFQLQARSNLCANPKQGSFNIPCNVFFNSATPALNDSGQWAIKLDVIGGTDSQGILFGSSGSATIAYQSPADALVSDASLNNAGVVAWPQTFSAQNGVYTYNSSTMIAGLLTSQPIGTSAWGGTEINELGQVAFRATLSGANAYYSFGGNPSLVTHAVEASLDSQSPYSFLFTPTFNDNRQMAAHVRLGAAGQTGNERPDEIRVFNADRSFTLIARDRDSDPASPYTAFDSSRCGLLNDGRVAFIANLFGGGRGVFLSNGAQTLTIATTGVNGVSVIDFFPPSVNEHGLVAFRGKDANGLSAIFAGDGSALRRVIGEHDLIMTDLGQGRIDQHDNSPVFGGGVSINLDGDIAFQCALAPPDNNQVEWGSGLYIALADPTVGPGDVNGDGVVNVNDLLMVIGAWGKCPVPCPPDIAPPGGDGVVNVNDLLMVIGNWD